MRVRWTTDAADDLERICDYIAQDRPEAARRVALSVVERIGTLEAFPRLGRSGRVPATRELAFPPLPFVAVYEVLDGESKGTLNSVIKLVRRDKPVVVYLAPKRTFRNLRPADDVLNCWGRATAQAFGGWSENSG